MAQIHDDDIGERVVNLYEFECLCGFEHAGRGLRDGLCGFRP